MSVRRVVAAGTGCYFRAARRFGFSTRASQQAELQASRELPDTPPLVVAGPGAGPALRVVLLGNGPAESPGAGSGVATFPSNLAQALASRTRCRVEVRTLPGAAFDFPRLVQQLQDEQLHVHDALVVTGAYRPQLAEISLTRWAAYTEALRSTLAQTAGPEMVIRVLSLPWRDAARNAPMQWGGLFGNRVRVVAEIAEATLTPDQQVLPLRLHAPVVTKEWIGPAFSAQTYLRWADQVAAELCTAWGL